MLGRDALHHSMGLGLALLVFGALTTSSPSARADTVDPAAKAQAKQLYDDGVTNYNLGHYDDALASFEKGYRLRQDPSFLFNIGQCQRQLRRYEDAERSYRAFLRESPDLPATSREQVQKLIAEMENAVAEQRAKQPPPGTMPPAETQPRPTTTTTAAAPPATTSRADLTAQAAPSHQEKPVYKRGWFWGVVVGAVVVVGVGVGLGVGLGTSKSNNPFPAVQF